MDIEFHYYMTYLIATRSGLGPAEARILAHSSQFIDDNDLIVEIDAGKGTSYRNYISQTMNILKPKARLLRIYPIFHFIPGDPRAKSAWRKDGKMHWLNTTPNSGNANEVMDAAIASNNLYRIGIAAHGYVDTWAHQNFIGYYDDFNSMDTLQGRVLPNIGHADAGHNPDWPALIWKDGRLLSQRVDNRVRFLEAAEYLLRKLSCFVDTRIDQTEISDRCSKLRNDLDTAIGVQDQANKYVSERIDRYKDLAQQKEYGDKKLPEYDEDLWFDNAVKENVRGFQDRSDAKLLRFDPFTDIYNWKDSASRAATDWFKFQEAVKTHQDETWDILEKATFQGLELEAL